MRLLQTAVILLLPGTAFAVQEDRLCTEGVHQLAEAMAAWDGESFRRAAARLQAEAEKSPDSAPCAYWAAVAEFHRAIEARGTADFAARLDPAISVAERAARLAPADPEPQALLCVLSGMKIEGHPWKALLWGPRVMKHGRRAREKGADNPRVQYLLGTCRFHSSKGSKDDAEALAYFERAEHLFVIEAARPAPDPLRPRWGRSGALFFLGQTLERLGRPAEAADAYRQVLSLQPAHRRAQARLAALSNPP